MQYKKNIIITLLAVLLLILAILLVVFFLNITDTRKQSNINVQSLTQEGSDIQASKKEISDIQASKNVKPKPSDYQFTTGEVLAISPKQISLQTEHDKVNLTMAEDVKIYWVNQDNTLKPLGIFDLKKGDNVVITKYDLKTQTVKEIKHLNKKN